VYCTVHEKCHVVCILQQFIILGPITRTVSDAIISSFNLSCGNLHFRLKE
jgi:hypothetical protein